MTVAIERPGEGFVEILVEKLLAGQAGPPTRLATVEQGVYALLLAPEVLLELMQLVNTCVGVLGETMRPDGYNVGMNIGTAAGAGIKDHIHMHVVPRWAGDTNYMPVCADTRVIVESLCDCYERLKPSFDRLIPPADTSD